MAHFAKMDSDNIVLKVHVLDNYVIADENGQDDEQKGIEFLQKLHKNENVYIQTSYNNNFRKNYAGKGYTYDQTRDAFIAPKPYPSWVLDEVTCRWEAPVPFPDSDGEKRYRWDEAMTNWIIVND